MINKILLFITALLSIILVISSNDTAFFNEEDISIKVLDNEETINLELEEYVIGVVAAEMPASFEEEALKAQAVASRTYGMYKLEHSNKSFDVIASVANQSYISIDEMHNKWGSDFTKYYNKIKKAVDSTKGEVITYNGNIIEAFYFSMSNGYTEDSSLVFNEDLEYIKSVESNYEKKVKNFEVINNKSLDEVKNKLNVNNFIVSNIKKDKTGRVVTIVIDGKEFSGIDVRKKLGLRSTDFEFNIKGDSIDIITRGYGHGVGMSQYGANGMAKEGKTYKEILKYYYNNVEIEKI